MFVTAIERAAEFTRPIHTIHRYFGSTDVHPGAATLFFVNSDGWALTCAHVAKHLMASQAINQRYKRFRAERDALGNNKTRKAVSQLQHRYGLNPKQVAESIVLFVNCIQGQLNLKIEPHPTLDVALLKFSDFTQLNCSSFPLFASNGVDLKQGKSLCRLGFPFPEFTNYSYDSASESINWNHQGREDSPRFPIEGMVTRHIGGSQNTITGFELSTPGLRGQSGGPAFDSEGRVWGMQSATNHLDLNFDVDMSVVRDGKKKHVTDSAFLHVGQCIHVDVLKAFMREKDVGFTEG